MIRTTIDHRSYHLIPETLTESALLRGLIEAEVAGRIPAVGRGSGAVKYFGARRTDGWKDGWLHVIYQIEGDNGLEEFFKDLEEGLFDAAALHLEARVIEQDWSDNELTRLKVEWRCAEQVSRRWRIQAWVGDSDSRPIVQWLGELSERDEQDLRLGALAAAAKTAVDALLTRLSSVRDDDVDDAQLDAYYCDGKATAEFLAAAGFEDSK